MSVWPPVPPEHPLRTPWWPPPPAPAPVPAPTGRSLIVDAEPDRLAERLAERRLLAVAGEVDRDAANRLVAELALLDASADDPVTLWLSGVSADLDAALAVVGALDLMGVEVRATCLGTITGAAVAILAVADRRTAAPHATVHLCEPRARHGGPGRDLEAQAAQHARQLRQVQERIATACRRPVDAVAADMRAGRLLSAEEAQEYGLVDAVGRARPER